MLSAHWNAAEMLINNSLELMFKLELYFISVINDIIFVLMWKLLL